MIGSRLQHSSPREKEKKGESFHKVCIVTLSCGHSLLIYRHCVCEFFTKTLRVMSISTNIYRLNAFDPLGLYIFLVNNSIEAITLTGLSYNYLYQCIKVGVVRLLGAKLYHVL